MIILIDLVPRTNEKSRINIAVVTTGMAVAMLNFIYRISTGGSYEF